MGDQYSMFIPFNLIGPFARRKWSMALYVTGIVAAFGKQDVFT